MNEHRFWQKVRGALHVPPHFFARKLSDQFVAGTPDCIWAGRGKMGFLELKYTEWPKRRTTGIKCGVTVEQRRYLEDVAATGNRAQVLLGVGKDWFLLEIHEVPQPSGPGAPQLSHNQLEAIRRLGRSGTFKTLSDLRDILANSRDPIDG